MTETSLRELLLEVVGYLRAIHEIDPEFPWNHHGISGPEEMAARYGAALNERAA